MVQTIYDIIKAHVGEIKVESKEEEEEEEETTFTISLPKTKI